MRSLCFPLKNATGNWIEVVQRLPVRIKLNPELTEHPLRIGLSMKVTINTKDQTGQLLSVASRSLPHYQTDIYQVQMSGITQVIKQIIQNNDIASQ
ncbi:hypothetical protein P4S72_29050 [Vibrio sp. PP-XX7]